MALRVKHVGQFGAHAAAKNAGVQVGDILVAYDGKTDLARETDVLAHGVTAKRPGDKVPLTLVRAGKRMELTVTLPP
jgi:S1-C subfamily serine protease